MSIVRVCVNHCNFNCCWRNPISLAQLVLQTRVTINKIDPKMLPFERYQSCGFDPKPSEKFKCPSTAFTDVKVRTDSEYWW